MAIPADTEQILAAIAEHDPDVLDWAVTWIAENVDSELWAPRQYIIVDELTRGSPRLAAIWRAIYRLSLLYGPRKRPFGFRIIAQVGGVGRGHLSDGIRKLHQLGLLTVIGLDDDTSPDRWRYAVDSQRLEAMSIALLRARLTEGQVVRRRRDPVTQQLDLFAALDGDSDPTRLRLSGPLDDDNDSVIIIPATRPAPDGASARSLAPVGAGVGSVAPSGASPHGASVGPVAPTGASSTSLAAPDGASLRDPSPAPAAPDRGSVRDGAPDGASLRSPVAPNGAALTPLAPAGAAHAPVPAPSGAMRHPMEPLVAPSGTAPDESREVSKNVSKEERERAHAANGALTHPDSLALLIRNTIQTELASIVAQLQLPLPLFPNGAAANLGDEVPTRPSADEPPVSYGLLAAWRIVAGCEAVPPRDEAQLRHLVARYDRPTGGHAAYWLVRAMLDADRARNDASPPISLRLITAYLHRMEAAGEFSTRVLENPKLGRRQGRGDAPGEAPALAPEPDAPAPAPAPAAEPTTSVPAPDLAPEPAPVRGGAVPPATPTLPTDLESAWAVAAWRRYAGPKLCLTPERAQQVIRAVSRPEVWDVVLANWAARERPNWTNLDALIEIYAREAAARPTQVTADAYDPDGPPATQQVLIYHPTLPETERPLWLARFREAASPAAKQAVIRRLLAAYPLPDEADFFRFVRSKSPAHQRD